MVSEWEQEFTIYNMLGADTVDNPKQLIDSVLFMFVSERTIWNILLADLFHNNRLKMLLNKPEVREYITGLRIKENIQIISYAECDRILRRETFKQESLNKYSYAVSYRRFLDRTIDWKKIHYAGCVLIHLKNIR